MFKKSCWLLGLAACLAMALSPELASAQRGGRGGGGGRGGASGYRGGGEYRGGGYGYRGYGGFGIGIGLGGYPGYYGYGYGAPGYYYGDGGASYDSTPYYSGGTTYSYNTPLYSSDPAPSGTTYSYGSTLTQATPAQISVQVPAGAKVWFDGAATDQQGTNRVFASPALTPGSNYYYTIKAQWREGDKDVTQSRRVDVRAGANVAVDFNKPAQ